jgi:hypothetical protein
MYIFIKHFELLTWADPEFTSEPIEFPGIVQIIRNARSVIIAPIRNILLNPIFRECEEVGADHRFSHKELESYDIN